MKNKSRLLAACAFGFLFIGAAHATIIIGQRIEIRGADSSGCGGWQIEVTTYLLDGGGTYTVERNLGPVADHCGPIQD